MNSHFSIRNHPLVKAAAGWLPMVISGLWVIALVSLPMTSFPLFSEVTGAIVTPFSALPIFILLVLVILSRILRGGCLPREVTPFLVFILVATAASAAALYIPFPGFKDRSPLDQELRSFVTLAVGIAFYLTFAVFPGDETRLRRTLQWIHLGTLILIIWAAIQAYYNARGLDFPESVQRINDFLSLKPPYFRSRGQRVTGFAYEASWLAHQMVILYLPLLLAAVYTRRSVFERKILWFSVEDVLLLPALSIFFLSSPRISLVSLLLIFFYIFWMLNVKGYRRLLKGLAGRLPGGKSRSFIMVLSGLALVVVIVSLYAALLGGMVYLASLRDWRVQLLLANPPTAQEIRSAIQMNELSLLNLAHRFAFFERMSYWLSGWNVFNRFPLLGVGLGNAGFFAFTDLPSLSWGSYEIRDYLFRSTALPNIKSLWIRLLAETGIVGFAVFLAFLILSWRSTSISRQSTSPLVHLTTTAGRFTILAFIAEGFSIDSFAMPYLWVMLGIVAATGMIYRRSAAMEATTAQADDQLGTTANI